MSKEYGLFINGSFRSSAVQQEIRDPASGELIARVCLAGEQDVEDALSGARQAFDCGPWRSVSGKERAAYLMKISQGILDKAQELAVLETRNTGKPIKESTLMDIPSSARSFSVAAGHIEQVLRDERVSIAEPFRSEALLRREGRGVVVLIVPWNYPLLIASWKLASALAAGNTVVLKPSTLTPLSVLELATIIQEAGIPEGVVNIVPGRGSVVGEQLCADRRVDMISFTGSNAVGKQIISYTAGSVKKMIMELGGKSASIVCKDADLEAAVNGALCSIFLNQGQMCTAMSRILIEEPVYDAFVRDFVQKAKRIKLGAGMDFQTQMGPLVSKEQRDSVLGFLRHAQQEGAHLLCGGKIPPQDAYAQGFFFEPTVCEGVTEQSELFCEEVFGPVAAVGSFKDIDDALRLANRSEYALAASIWSRDVRQANALAERLDAGVIWINTYGMFFDELPYGGFKQSGFGKELGVEGMREYTRLKNIITDASADGKPLVHFWYGL